MLPQSWFSHKNFLPKCQIYPSFIFKFCYFRRILTRQNERLASELLLLHAGSDDTPEPGSEAGSSAPVPVSRDLLSDPECGLLALLMERRRLLPPRSPVNCNSLVNNNNSNIPIVQLENDVKGTDAVDPMMTRGVDSVLFQRRRTLSDPGPVRGGKETSAADALVRARARETLSELRQVSDKTLEVCVAYLKSAAMDVINSSVEDVKALLSCTKL